MPVHLHLGTLYIPRRSFAEADEALLERIWAEHCAAS